MREEMIQVRTRREEALTPLRERSLELKEKLKLVESQLESTHFYRERRSQSRLDLDSPSATNGGGHFLMSQSSSEHSRIAEAGEENGEDFSPSSPPPYSPFGQ